MPSDFMPVPHYQQNNPGACLLACVRMVSATFGHELTELEIGQVIGSYSFGAPADSLSRLRRLGYQVSLTKASLIDLQRYLANGQAPIVFVAAEHLPWAKFSGFHALVLIGEADGELLVLDPALESGPTPLPQDLFSMAWAEFDQRIAVIAY